MGALSEAHAGEVECHLDDQVEVGARLVGQVEEAQHAPGDRAPLAAGRPGAERALRLDGQEGTAAPVVELAHQRFDEQPGEQRDRRVTAGLRLVQHPLPAGIHVGTVLVEDRCEQPLPAAEVVVDKGLAEVLAGAGFDIEASAARTGHDVLAELDALLRVDQQAGAVRKDVDVEDVKA